jgi:prepilin-type N-terminal cleavage/methylation domain-containing protein
MRTGDDYGYTMVELLVVMAILTATMAAVLPWLYTNLNQTVRTQGRLESIEEGRGALRQFARELRQASKLINVADRPSKKDSISFEADLNNDGLINSCTDTSLPSECITYEFRAQELIRGRKKDEGAVIATNLTEMDLEYVGNDPTLDGNGDGLVTESEIGPDSNGDGVPDNLNSFLDRISMIRVSLTFRVRGQEVTVSEDVGLRNLNEVAQNQ